MDQNDDIRFIDEDSPRSDNVEYVWKKKKAVQREKEIRTDLRLNLKSDESNTDDDWSKSDFNPIDSREDSIDLSFMEQCDLSFCESSLSPRAPVVNSHENRNEIQLDVLFTDDVTVNVSFKGGKIVIEEKSEDDKTDEKMKDIDEEIDEIVQASNNLSGNSKGKYDRQNKILKCDLETKCSVENSFLGNAITDVNVVSDEYEVKIKNKCDCGNKINEPCPRISNDQLKINDVDYQKVKNEEDRGNVEYDVKTDEEKQINDLIQTNENLIEEELKEIDNNRNVSFVSNLEDDKLVIDKLTDQSIQNRIDNYIFCENILGLNPFVDTQISELIYPDNIDTISIDGQIIEIDKSKIAELVLKEKSLCEDKSNSIKEEEEPQQSCKYWFPYRTNLDLVADSGQGLNSAGISGLVLHDNLGSGKLGEFRGNKETEKSNLSSFWLIEKSEDKTEEILNSKENALKVNKDFNVTENDNVNNSFDGIVCSDNTENKEIINILDANSVNGKQYHNHTIPTILIDGELSNENETQNYTFEEQNIESTTNVEETKVYSECTNSIDTNDLTKQIYDDLKGEMNNENTIEIITVEINDNENKTKNVGQIISNNLLTVPNAKYGKENYEQILYNTEKGSSKTDVSDINWSRFSSLNDKEDIIEEEIEGLETIFEENETEDIVDKDNEDSDDETYYDSENYDNTEESKLEIIKDGNDFKQSLQVLNTFRDNLMPGITSASNWINNYNSSDSDEIGLSMEEEGNDEDSVCEDVSRVGEDAMCRRANLSTGAVDLMLFSAERYAPPTVSQTETFGLDSDNVSANSISDRVDLSNTGEINSIVSENSTDSYSTVQSAVSVDSVVKYIDQEIQVDNSICAKCENSENESKISSSDRSENLINEIVNNDLDIDVKNNSSDTCLDSNENKTKEKEGVNFKGLNLDFVFNKPNDLKCVKDLPLIFPRARQLSINKNNDNVFGGKKSTAKENFVNNENINETVNVVENDKGDIKTDESFNKLKYNFSLDGVRNLFQFNVNKNDEGVTSFCEDIKSGSEDEMKQKKKNEEMESSSSNSDICNGYHRQGLKSALKRSSTKKSKKKNRVQFDESLNKFFDADYVILIREEPEEFEGDYDVSGCDCGDDFCYEGCCDEDDQEYEDEDARELYSENQKFDLCAAFEPPMEFVDQVTLSPPDGYKDISHSCCPHHYHQRNLAIQEHRRKNDDKEEWTAQEEREDMQPVVERRSEATNTEEGDLNEDPNTCSEASQCSEQSLAALQHEQQTQQQRYIVETITMTTVTERRIVREADDQLVRKTTGDQDDGKLNGILKGGKLWKSTDSGNQTDLDENPKKIEEISTNFDEEGKRSVRFSEGQNETETKDTGTETESNEKFQDCTEMNLTFKVGNHVIVSNSSKPNSAVRQLFPGPKFITPPPVPNRSPDSEDNQDDKKYLVTSESLKLFEEAKKSKLQQYYSCRNKDSCSQTLNSPQDHQSDEDDGLQSNLIKRTIERNTLRRSLLKYPHDMRLKRNQNKMKNENSLVERIRQLTCDVDEDSDEKQKDDMLPARTSPPGEESQKTQGNQKTDKVTSSGMSSTYKKLTDLFTRRDKLEAAHPSVLQTPISIGHQYPYYQPVYHQTSPPDLGNGLNTHLIGQKTIVRHSVTAEARKQFLSSLAPLTACVSGNIEESPGNKEIQLNQPGERNSIASTSTAAETEYSLDDIEEVLNTQTEDSKSQPQPDVVAGTPGGNSEQDELALFVQQDASRIERIRKRYSSTPSSAGSDDDEHDDYGFNRRPSVRGIKPRFGSTTEILQQMQSQVQPPGMTCPSRVTWPYYTPTDVRTKTNRGVMPIVKEEPPFTYIPDPNLDYSNSSVDGGRGYQIYSSTGNLHQPMRIGGGGDLQYHPRPVHHYSESPPRVPPVGMMLPFQETDYPYRTTAPIYARRAVPGSVVQMRVSPGHPIRFNPPYVEPEPHYSTQPLPPGTTSIIRVGQQQTIRVPYTTGGPVQVHLLATRRSESPQRGSPSYQQNQFVVARGTQTTYYHVPNNPRGTYYPPPPPPPQNGPNYNNRGPLIFSDKSQNIAYNNNYPNNPHRATSPIPSLTSSPTRIKPPERGVPEGAASSSPGFPQDSMYLHVSSSTNTSPPGQDNQATTQTDIVSSPNANPTTQTSGSSVFYAMNV